jgi:hypothetical protein
MIGNYHLAERWQSIVEALSQLPRLLCCSNIRGNSCLRKGKNWPLISIDRFDAPLKW